MGTELNTDAPDLIQPRPITGSEEKIAPRSFIEPKPIAERFKKKGLTLQQFKFCQNFVGGMSAHKAAKEAGYSDSTAQQASQILLQNPFIIRELNRLTARWFRHYEITADKIIGEAAKLAHWNILDYGEFGPDGKFEFTNLHMLTREQAAAITEIGYDSNGKIKIRFTDKKSCLELLARLKKLLSDTGKDPSSNDEDSLTINKLDAIIARNTNITINNQYNFGADVKAPSGPVIDSKLLPTSSNGPSAR